MKKRMTVFFFIMMCCFCFMMVNIYRITNQEWLKEVALHHGTYKVQVAKLRGTIYDCNKIPLVGRESEKIAVISPSANSSDVLQNVLSREDFKGILPYFSRGIPFKVKAPVSLVTTDDIFVFDVARRYSETSLAPHVIGYLDEKGDGVCGVEYAYQDMLSLPISEISMRYKTDALGRVLMGDSGILTDTSCLAKRGVVLTLDERMQNIALRASNEFMKKGAIIITEVPSCKIRACVSVPAFSQLDPGQSIKDHDAPFLNRAMTAYNVGSIYKLVTAGVALESGIGDNDEYDCKGAHEVDGTVFRCSSSRAHGKINLQDAIAQSCNTYFVNLSQKISPEKLLEKSYEFGFDTAINLAPQFSCDKGSLPSCDDLKNTGNMANLSFGQSSLMATPLQIAGFINAIASGGVYSRPMLVEGIVDENMEFTNRFSNRSTEKRVLDRKIAGQLRDCMVASVEHGTSIKGKPEHLMAGAKTATAETGIVQDNRKIQQTWYAGFYPSDWPKYSIVILVEDGESGGTSCGPIFKAISDSIYDEILVKEA